VKRDNINMTIIVYLPLVLRILVITRIFHQEVRLNNQIMTKLSWRIIIKLRIILMICVLLFHQWVYRVIMHRWMHNKLQECSINRRVWMEIIKNIPIMMRIIIIIILIYRILRNHLQRNKILLLIQRDLNTIDKHHRLQAVFTQIMIKTYTCSLYLLVILQLNDQVGLNCILLILVLRMCNLDDHLEIHFIIDFMKETFHKSYINNCFS